MFKVSTKILLLITASIWMTACCILLVRSYIWANDMSFTQLALAIPIGIILGSIKTKFIFSKLNQKNITRINSYKEKVSIWNFHINKDKLLILLMIIIGVILRRTPFIPKELLMPIYLGIGLSMFYVVIMYITAFIKKRKDNIH